MSLALVSSLLPLFIRSLTLSVIIFLEMSVALTQKAKGNQPHTECWKLLKQTGWMSGRRDFSKESLSGVKAADTE